MPLNIKVLGVLSRRLIVLIFLCVSLKVDAQISFSPNSAVQNSSTFGVTVGPGPNFLPGTTTCVQIQTPTTLSLTNVMVSSNSSLSGDLFVPPGTPPEI